MLVHITLQRILHIGILHGKFKKFHYYIRILHTTLQQSNFARNLLNPYLRCKRAINAYNYH